MQNNSGYSPVKKNQVVVFIANFDEMQKTSGGIYTGNDDDIFDRISRIREGILTEITQGCFEDFHIKPEIGTKVSFKGYSGEIYEKDKEYYRIFEDKHIIATVK